MDYLLISAAAYLLGIFVVLAIQSIKKPQAETEPPPKYFNNAPLTKAQKEELATRRKNYLTDMIKHKKL